MKVFICEQFAGVFTQHLEFLPAGVMTFGEVCDEVGRQTELSWLKMDEDKYRVLGGKFHI